MKTTKKKFRVALAYKQWPDAVLDEFAGHTVTCLTGNTAFPAPTVTLPDITALQAAFHTAIDNAADGGTQLTALKDQAREALVEALDQNAAYVQSIAAFDLPTLKSSGYFETSSNHAQSPLNAPGFAAVLNEQPAQLTLRLTPVLNAYAYEVQIRNGTVDWKSAGTFTQARRIVLGGLTSGSSYTMQARAIGGSTGSSGWSDSVSHVVT